MPRPQKCRRVCGLPRMAAFVSQPRGDDPVLTMSVEEYETIRLIDCAGLTQEQCAQQMDVARTTVQRIYACARKKLGCFLTQGGTLRIEGGNYALCADCHRRCRQDGVQLPCKRCRHSS